MLSCLPLVVGIRAQEHLGVGLINLEPLRFVTSLGKLCIIELLLHEQIGIFRLQTLDGGQLFQRQIVKRLLRCLVDGDVALVRIVIFSGIPGLAISGDLIFLRKYIYQCIRVIQIVSPYQTELG